MCRIWLLFFTALIAIPPSSASTLCPTARWAKEGITVLGGTQGNATNQLHSPWEIYIDLTDALYIADRLNHRIVKWEQGASADVIVAGGLGPGVKPGQLYQPISVTVDKQGTMYVTEDLFPGSRVTRWLKGSKVGDVLFEFASIIANGITLDPNDEDYLYLADQYEHSVLKFSIKNISMQGLLVAGGNGRGPALDQLEQPTGVMIDNNRVVYVVDSRNSRIVKWLENATAGIVVAGGNGAGNETDQLSYPEAFCLDRQTNTVYVADTGNSRVVRTLDGAPDASVLIVAGNGKGNGPHQLSSAYGLAFDSHGNVYVSDSENNRIQVFVCSSSTKFIVTFYFITLITFTVSFF